MDEVLLKGKRLPIGSVRNYNGKDYVKKGEGKWVLKGSENDKKPAKKEEKSSDKEYTMKDRLAESKRLLKEMESKNNPDFADTIADLKTTISRFEKKIAEDAKKSLSDTEVTPLCKQYFI